MERVDKIGRLGERGVGGIMMMRRMILPQQFECKLRAVSRMAIEMINIYRALSIVDLKCCGGAGVV